MQKNVKFDTYMIRKEIFVIECVKISDTKITVVVQRMVFCNPYLILLTPSQKQTYVPWHISVTVNFFIIFLININMVSILILTWHFIL